MAKNPPPGDNHRKGAVTGRSQTYNPKTDSWVKRDTESGRFMDQKYNDKPFKGVRRERDERSLLKRRRMVAREPSHDALSPEKESAGAKRRQSLALLFPG